MEWFERIKMLRKQKGWSQDTLAQRAGYTDRSMISKIEKGGVDLQRSQLIKFAEIFDVSPSWLLGSVEEQQEEDDGLEELIAKYKQLDDEGKEMMHERLDSLIKHGHVKEPEVITLNPPDKIMVVSVDGKKTSFVGIDAAKVVATAASPAPSKFHVKYRPHTPAGVGSRPHLKKILNSRTAKRKKEG